MSTVSTLAGAAFDVGYGSGDKPLNTLDDGVEIAFHVLMALMFLGGLWYVVGIARRDRSLVPIYLLVGGGLAIFYEPMGDLAAHVTYHADQTTAASGFGFEVPTWMVPAYPVIVGVSMVWLMDVVRKGVTPKLWWGLYFGTIASLIVFELPMIALDAVEYFGTQTISIYGYPVWMAFANATGLIFVPTVIVYALLRSGVITSRNAIVLVPLTPMLAAGCHTAFDFVRSVTINGDREHWQIETVSLLSMGAAVMTAWLCLRVLQRMQTGPRAAEPVLDGAATPLT